MFFYLRSCFLAFQEPLLLLIEHEVQELKNGLNKFRLFLVWQAVDQNQVSQLCLPDWRISFGVKCCENFGLFSVNQIEIGSEVLVV